MPVEITETQIKNILTRTTGYLKTVTSHSLQPYRGCTFGNSLCGVGCYVQHNGHVLKGRRWGHFLEVRTNAAASYLENYDREKRWAHQRGQRFSIFCSSATDPFVPQEFRFGITRSVFEAIRDAPPDLLVVQTHSHRAEEYIDLCRKLTEVCQLRLHMSIACRDCHRQRVPSGAGSKLAIASSRQEFRPSSQSRHYCQSMIPSHFSPESPKWPMPPSSIISSKETDQPTAPAL